MMLKSIEDYIKNNEHHHSVLTIWLCACVSSFNLNLIGSRWTVKKRKDAQTTVSLALLNNMERSKKLKLL